MFDVNIAEDTRYADGIIAGTGVPNKEDVVRVCIHVYSMYIQSSILTYSFHSVLMDLKVSRCSLLLQGFQNTFCGKTGVRIKPSCANEDAECENAASKE